MCFRLLIATQYKTVSCQPWWIVKCGRENFGGECSVVWRKSVRKWCDENRRLVAIKCWWGVMFGGERNVACKIAVGEWTVMVDGTEVMKAAAGMLLGTGWLSLVYHFRHHYHHLWCKFVLSVSLHFSPFHYLPCHHDFFPVSSLLAHSINIIVASIPSPLFVPKAILFFTYSTLTPLPPVTVVVNHLDRLLLKLQLCSYFVSFIFLYCNTACWDAYQCGYLVHWCWYCGQPRISIWCMSNAFHPGVAKLIRAVSMNGSTKTRQQ